MIVVRRLKDRILRSPGISVTLWNPVIDKTLEYVLWLTPVNETCPRWCPPVMFTRRPNPEMFRGLESVTMLLSGRRASQRLR